MKPQLLPLQSNMKVIIGTIGIISCTCQIATASPSLADKSLIHVTSNYSPKAIKITNPQNQIRLLKPTTKFDNLIKKVQTISQGGGYFGKKVKTVIGRDTVGLQYSTQW